jgi:anti-sigma factor RsiW
MFDCANVEMRELLPELAAGTLDAATRSRVEEHVRSCAECASELETLRAVRGAFAATPAVDTRRIAASLPKPPAAGARPSGGAPVKRWIDWRVAAALTMITVGGLSVAVSQRRGNDSQPVAPFDSTVVASSPDSAPTGTIDSSVGGAPTGGVDTGNASTTRRVATPRSAAKAQLSVNGGVSDLDEASLRALLGALDEIDRAPVAPSAEPDRSSVLPVIKGDDR